MYVNFIAVIYILAAIKDAGIKISNDRIEQCYTLLLVGFAISLGTFALELFHQIVYYNFLQARLNKV